MRNFTSVHDIGDLSRALEKAKAVKEHPFADQELGKNKTLMLIFFNSSLRTRLSTQKAGLNLGMNVIVLDINQGAWKLRSEEHTSELQSRPHLVCRLLLEKKKKKK